MSPLLLLCVFLPFISATAALEDHEGKSPKLEVALKLLVSERVSDAQKQDKTKRNICSGETGEEGSLSFSIWRFNIT